MTELLDWCVDKEHYNKVKARIEYGTNVAAARALGISEASIRRAVKKARYIMKQASGVEIAVAGDLPKILIIDIETSPTKAFIWRMWKENIGNNQVIDHSYIMCFSAKWFGEDEIIYSETRTEDDSSITKQMIELLDQADFVVAHNASRFDVPRINAAAIINGMKPPSPYRVIDTLKVAKKHFKFERNTLEHIAEILGCTPKSSHAKFNGFELWKECLDGNEEAWEEMRDYNIQDVHTLEEVYLKLRPWHKEHPNLGSKMESDVPVCSRCGSPNLKQKGYTYTDVSKFPLFHCKDCGSYSRSRYSEYPKEIRASLLTTVRAA